MRIDADKDVCIGAGVCALAIPEIFDQDFDDGRVLLLREPLGDGEHHAVRRAVSLCPSGALSIQEGHDDGLAGVES